MRKWSVFVAAIALLVWGGRTSAHEGHLHKVLGTVAVLDATHIEVDTTDGKRESFLLTANTKYIKGKKPCAASDVKIGARVALSVVQKDGKKNVTEILIGEVAARVPAPATKP